MEIAEEDKSRKQINKLKSENIEPNIEDDGSTKSEDNFEFLIIKENKEDSTKAIDAVWMDYKTIQEVALAPVELIKFIRPKCLLDTKLHTKKNTFIRFFPQIKTHEVDVPDNKESLTTTVVHSCHGIV